jgi:hypothetical protein
MMISNKEAVEREDIEALLPWHAAGTLSRRDADRVEKALANDNELARRYDLVCEELNETIHLNESLGAPSARCMEKLFAAIDTETAKAPVRRASFDFGGRIAAFLSGFAPRTLAYAGAAAVLAIMVQAAVITGVVVKEQGGTARTQLASYGQTDGSLVSVRFAPQATAADITSFLNTYQAQVVEGPKQGRYTVRLAVAGQPKSEIVKVIRKMQDDSKVVDFIAAIE